MTCESFTSASPPKRADSAHMRNCCVPCIVLAMSSFAWFLMTYKSISSSSSCWDEKISFVLIAISMPLSEHISF